MVHPNIATELPLDPGRCKQNAPVIKAASDVLPVRKLSSRLVEFVQLISAVLLQGKRNKQRNRKYEKH
jgi:hypothetical protein